MESRKPRSQARRIPRNWLLLSGGGSREIGVEPEQGRQWKLMEECEGREAKQDEDWAVSFGFSSGVVADLGKHTS